MPKSSQEQIDNDDRKIISQMQINSKESIDKIAKKCGFSRQKVWRTIKRLEKNKIIWGYSVIVDNEKNDLNHYIVLFRRSTLPIDDNMQNAICKEKLDYYFPETNVTVLDVFYVNGKYDWVVSFTAPGIREMKMFCEKCMRKFGKYIIEYDVLETIVPVRISGIKNPIIDEKSTYL